MIQILQKISIWNIYQKYLSNNDKFFGQTHFVNFFPKYYGKFMVKPKNLPTQIPNDGKDGNGRRQDG